jgi:ATP/maltotriose-dependent transcriptional regulator MalT
MAVTDEQPDEGFNLACRSVLRALDPSDAAADLLFKGLTPSGGGDKPSVFGVDSYRISIELHVVDAMVAEPSDLFPRATLRQDEPVDLVIILTNADLSDSATDWLSQTKTNSSFPIAVWNRRRINALAASLGGSHSNKPPNESLKKTIIQEIERHRSRRQAMFFDPRLRKPISDRATSVKPFIDRLLEIKKLTAFSDYKVAGVIGPMGIGKSTLVRETLRQAEREGFSSTVLSAEADDLTFNRWIVHLANFLADRCASKKLLLEIKKYGSHKVEDLTETALQSIKTCRAYIAVEDVHALRPDNAPSLLIDKLSRNIGNSRLLFTSRNSIPWPSWVLVPHLHIRLEGFDETSIEDYFRSHHLDCPKSIVRQLARQHHGWPLVVAEVGYQLSVEKRARRGSTKRLLDQARENVGPAIAEALAGRINSEARRLLGFLICLRVPMTKGELSIAMEIPVHRLENAWRELVKQGAVGDSLELHKSIHGLLKVNLRPVLGSASEIEHELGVFLRGSADDPERVAAAVEHFLAIGELREAAKTLIAAGDTLIRCGLLSTILRLLASIDPASVSESHFLSLVLLRVTALETLGRIDEAKDTLETFFHPAAIDEIDIRLGAQFYYRLARIHYFHAGYADSSKSVEHALALLNQYGGPKDRESFLLKARCLTLRARIIYIDRNLSAAENLYVEALTIHLSFSDRIGANKVRHRLAMIDLLRGETTKALSAFKGVERESRRIGDAKRLSYALHRVAEIEIHRKNYKSAAALLKESIRIKKRIGHARGLLYTNIELAELSMLQGDFKGANLYATRSLDIVSTLSMPKEEALTYRLLGKLRQAEGRLDEGVGWLRKATEMFERIGLPARAKAIREHMLGLLRQEQAN